jgi:hypothetical protein
MKLVREKIVVVSAAVAAAVVEAAAGRRGGYNGGGGGRGDPLVVRFEYTFRGKVEIADSWKTISDFIFCS